MPRNLQRSRQVQTSPQPSGVQTEKPKYNRRSLALREVVLDNIGKPDDLLDVDIKTLQDENHYRVNVYREIGAVRKMTDSFYVVVKEDSVVSSPPMSRRYHDDILEKMTIS